jgi:unsaturated rhamnogalacturonyl hydrolase
LVLERRPVHGPPTRAAKLVTLQKPDGYWSVSLLAPEHSPPESSGTGFFIYGLA